ncbi:MAG: lipopolysaccharide biosynthesis protein [Steroidobacteraceae bacterium]
MVLSLTNFLVGFVLIRYATDHDYALYVLVQSTLLLVVSLQNSYLSGPVAILTPKLPADERWQTIGSVKRVQRRLLRAAAVPLVLLPLLGYVSGILGGLLASVMEGAIFAIWAALRREYLRSVLLMYFRPHTLLGADTVYAVTLLAGVSAAILIGRDIVVGATCALVIAGWAGAAAAHRSLANGPGWQENRAVSIWPEIRGLGFWAVVGSTIWWVLGQSYSYLLATRLDLTAVADVNATRLLLMPAIALAIGVGSLLSPTAASWYAQIGIHRLVRRLLMFLLVVGLLEVTYFFTVWMGREWLVVGILHKHIHDRDRLLILWVAFALIGLCRDVLQCALVALGRYKSLAWQVGVSAAVSVVLMWYGVGWWGAPGVLIGMIVGELINLAGIIVLLRRCMRRALVS